MNKSRGYTLVELIVAVGIFALVMMLASGAYFIMIGVSRQATATATGIDNLAFAVETMTRTIRTGTEYTYVSGGDCTGSETFSVKNADGDTVTYTCSGGAIRQDGAALTDPSVTISALDFYAYGTGKPPDYHQPRVTFVISGTVSSGPGKTEYFTIESGATMRGTDI